MKKLGTCPCDNPCDAVAKNVDLMRYGEPFRFRRGEVLWEQGGAATDMLAICVGTVKLTRDNPRGRDFVLGLAGRGEVVGEESALGRSRRGTHCVALSAGRAVRITRARLQSVLIERPELYQRLLGLACERFDALGSRLDEFAEGPVEARLARTLLRLGRTRGMADARGCFVPLRVTRRDLAAMVGCRPETAVRALRRWQAQGALDILREGLVIRRPETLEAYDAQREEPRLAV